MSRTCLIHIYGVHNLLPAICAVRWYGLHFHGTPDCHALVVLANPGVPDAKISEMGRVAERIVSSFGWSVRVLSDYEMTDITYSGPRTRYAATLYRFKRELGLEFVDEIYYSHNLVGRCVELVVNAYRSAVKVTFGDGFGQVYDSRYLKLFNTDLEKTGSLRHEHSWGNWIMGEGRHIIRRLLLGLPRPCIPDKAVLILPMDHTGDGLDGVELLVVPKTLVIEVVRQFNRVLPEISEVTTDLLHGERVRPLLVLLANLADCGFASVDDEVSMYLDAIRRNGHSGATVILKEHPLGVAPLAESLVSVLQSDFRVRRVPREYCYYQAELWPDLVLSCNLLAYASSVVNLQFLYSKDVVFGLDRTTIEKYVRHKYHRALMDGERLYKGQLDSLEGWDGKSVLWSGKCS